MTLAVLLFLLLALFVDSHHRKVLQSVIDSLSYFHVLNPE
jgi:hypothetical protein